MSDTESPSVRDLLQALPWHDRPAPADVLDCPTMLSPGELSLLYYLARDYCSGAGRIVDAGCFLGGSTKALATGLRDRSDSVSEEIVFSYDRFLVEEYTISEYSSSLPSTKLGSSFRAAFDRNLRGFEDHLDVREGDVCDFGWHGEPIEVLFLDILKSWKINDLFLSQFFGCLIPGRSVVVQQDYAWGFCPWIHISMELLSDYFTWIDYVPHASYVYLYEREIPESLLRMRLRAGLSGADKRSLMDRAVARADGEVRAMLQLAQAMLLVEIGPHAQGVALHAQVKREFPDSEMVQACAKASEPWMKRAWATRLRGLGSTVIDALGSVRGRGLSPRR